MSAIILPSTSGRGQGRVTLLPPSAHFGVLPLPQICAFQPFRLMMDIPTHLMCNMGGVRCTQKYTIGGCDMCPKIYHGGVICAQKYTIIGIIDFGLHGFPRQSMRSAMRRYLLGKQYSFERRKKCFDETK